MDVALNSTTGLPYTSTDFLSNLGFNPMVLIVLGSIIIIYYFIFASLGKSSDSPAYGSVGHGGIIFLEVLLWGVFIVLILLNGMSYFFNINIIASIKNLFSDIPQIQISSTNLGGEGGSANGDGLFGSSSWFGSTGIVGDGSTTVPEIKISKQVFNIPGNYYTYDNANALCQAYGARLATYGEVEDSYTKGADWCNYGWSDNQLALFPTSKEKWEKLQTIKGHENDCGRQGVNGGYIANPNVQFGANCYGYKPKMTQTEQLLMNDTPLYPQTTDELNFEKKVAYLKTQLPSLFVSPFNNSNWSIV